MKETGAIDVFLNPSRHGTWDEFEIDEVGEERMFGPVKMVWMAVVPTEAMKNGRRRWPLPSLSDLSQEQVLVQEGNSSLSARHARREGSGHAVLDPYVNKGETADNLKDLGSQFKLLPPGWKFRTKVLDRDLTIAPPPPTHLGWVTMDEFKNTYQGCGYDAACNYVP